MGSQELVSCPETAGDIARVFLLSLGKERFGSKDSAWNLTLADRRLTVDVCCAPVENKTALDKFHKKNQKST